MLYNFLRTALGRHLSETLPLINQVTDPIIMKDPVEGGRPFGEILLHILRSIEFYLRGLVENKWEALPYTLEKYNSADKIKTLTADVFEKVTGYMDRIGPDDLSRVVDSFNRPASVAELLLEVIEHSIHHRGQVTVYYRLLGIKSESIPYIV